MQELIDGVDRLQDAEVRRVMEILERARQEVGARIAATEWQAAHIPQLKEAIGRAIETIKQRYGSEQTSALSNMWNAGIDAVDAPLAEAGIRVAAPEISRSVLEVLQGYSADLVQGLSADALKAVNNEIVMGIMGQKQPYEVMQAIGRSLDDPGVFKTIAGRAEAITRTEMARVNSAAAAARARDGAEAMERLGMKPMKKWISSGKAHPRPNHAALDGKMVPVGEKFPGGIDYPHAPGLPASESVNCG
jgi:hypothetical protein